MFHSGEGSGQALSEVSCTGREHKISNQRKSPSAETTGMRKKKGSVFILSIASNFIRLLFKDLLLE